jgi:hypothetical protein
VKTYTTILKTWLVFLLIAISTIPIFKQSFGLYLLLFSLLLTLKELRINKEAILFLLVGVGLELYHYFYFDDYDGLKSRQLIFIFVSCLILMYYVKLDFLEIYIRILYYFSLISFVFFALYYADKSLAKSFSLSIPEPFVKKVMVYGSEVKQPNPVFYNFDTNYIDFGRNNGPFWEPTVFATMLIIAQIFNLLSNKTLFNRKGIVFSVAILTTLSTTGFLAYFLLIAFYFLLSDKIKLFAKLVLSIGVLIVGIYSYTSLPFLGEKLQNEIEKADYEMDKYGGDSRLASAMLDIKETQEKPIYFILGRGSSSNTRVASPESDGLRNCGDTALLAEWGILYAVLFISLLFYSFLELTRFFRISWIFSIVFTLIILICSFSEVYLDLPFFYSLLFFGFIVKRFYIPASEPESGAESWLVNRWSRK